MKHIKLKTRIYGLVIFLLLSMTIVSVASLKIITDLGHTIKKIGEDDIPLVRVIAQCTEQILNQSLNFNTLLQYAKIHNKEKFIHSRDGFIESGKRFVDLMKEGKAIAQTGIKVAGNEHEKEAFEKIKETLKLLEQEHSEFEHHSEELIQALYIKTFKDDFKLGDGSQSSGSYPSDKSGHTSSAEKKDHAASSHKGDHDTDSALKEKEKMIKVVERLEKETMTMEHELNKGLELADDLTRSLLDHAHHEQVVGMDILIPMMLISLVGGLLLSGFIAKTAVDTIQNSTRKMKEIAETVSAASEQMAAAANELANSTVSQAERLSQISDDISSFNNSIQANSQAATKTKGFIQNIDKVVVSADKAMKDLSAAIRGTMESEEKSGKLFRRMSDYNIQINMLATSATAEAMRSETSSSLGVFTKKLDKTTHAAHAINIEISNLINTSLEKVKKNAVAATDMKTVLKKIISLTTNANQIISNVTTSSQKQAKDINTIDKLIHSLNDVTQSNAAASEESSASSVSMANQVKHLLDIVKDLEVMVEGKKALEGDEQHGEDL